MESNGQIDSTKADIAWKQNTKDYAPAVTESGGSEDQNLGSNQYAKARAVREHYQARLAKLEFEQKSGQLVSKDEVKIAAFNKFRAYRDAMLNIPDRLASALAAETDPASVHEMLTAEIRKALQEFADASR